MAVHAERGKQHVRHGDWRSLGVKFVGKLTTNTRVWLSTQEKKIMAISTLEEIEVMLLGIMSRAEVFKHQLLARGIVWSWQGHIQNQAGNQVG
jgi:hypothetical protein